MTTTNGIETTVAVRIIAGIITLLMLAGCSTATTKASTPRNSTTSDSAMKGTTMKGSTMKDDTMKDAFSTLMKRPNLAEVEADYQSMLVTIQKRLVAEVGIAPWVPLDEPATGTLCGGDLIDLADARQGYIDTGVSIGNLPDARWGQAVEIVTEVAGRHGFGDPGVVVDGPGDHEIVLRGTDEGELIFGTGGGTILTVRTGCHLTEEAHQRGTYLPPKEY